MRPERVVRAERPPQPALREDAASTPTEILEWFLLEKRCCPFLRFSLTLEPGTDDVRIHLGGGSEVKEFLAASGLATLRQQIRNCC